MLMGTADVVASPVEKIVFLEDMTDLQKAEKVKYEAISASILLSDISIAGSAFSVQNGSAFYYGYRMQA